MLFKYSSALALLKTTDSTGSAAGQLPPTLSLALRIFPELGGPLSSNKSMFVMLSLYLC